MADDSARMVHDALLDLHRAAGEPKPDELLSHADRAGARISRNTLYELLAGSGIPARATVDAFMAACVTHGEQRRRHAAVAQYKDQRWQEWVKELRDEAARQKRARRSDRQPGRR